MCAHVCDDDDRDDDDDLVAWSLVWTGTARLRHDEANITNLKVINPTRRAASASAAVAAAARS